MAQSALMKQGLEGLFNPKSQFESEADYGKKILKVAWTVEILAALTGLFIAWGQGYDVYNSIDNPSSSDLLGAVMGALPFVIIAVIEPTKIPLAGGFYKTKILGWKLLILASLLGLTIVTFETMFNGLERNLTNVTRQVVDANNNILFLSNSIDEKNRKLAELEGISASGSTADITDAINNLDADYNKFISGENASVAEQTKPFRERLSELESQRAGLAGQLGDDAKAGIDLLREQIAGLEKEINSINQTAEAKIGDYKQSLASEGAQNNKNKEDQIALLNTQKQDKLREIDNLRQQINSSQEKLNSDLSLLSANLESKLTTITAEMNTAVKNKKWTTTENSVRKPFNERIELAKKEQQDSSRRLKGSFEELKTANNDRINELTKAINDLDGSLTSLASQSTVKAIIDTNVIEGIRTEAARKIAPLQRKITNLQNNITSKIEAQSGVAKSKGAALDAEIKQLNERIDDIKIASDRRISQRKEQYSLKRQEIEAARNARIIATTEEKEEIPLLRSGIVAIQEEIDANKKVKRDAAYDSQIYRLAALAYGKNDVADVTTDEIKMVSVIWFGTVATIVATTGTILALISYILRDPEAFVERKKFSLTRRLSRLFYLFFSRLNRVLLSAFNILTALTRLILSFAEIFRGLIGVPVQRAFRKAMLAYRKRLNRPRVEFVEKEIEKIVEVEVEKIIEVEKIVEKIVEKEVPVEKVVVQEVPVEIVRKELVYVPLYSTESGLIDASTQLRDAVPKLGGDHKEVDSEQRTQEKSAPAKKSQRKKRST